MQFQQRLNSFIKSYVRKLGIDIVRFGRMKLIFQNDINLIFDVGANTGQYAKQIRRLGYKNRIVSFEPLTSAFNRLRKKSRKDPLWAIENLALGDFDGTASINIAGNSVSSSILEMLPSHVKLIPDSATIGKEEIDVRKIDTVIDNYYRTGDKIFLKIDTQGYEKNVIQGALSSIKYIAGIQMEISTVSLYQDELLFTDMLKFVESKGYKVMSLEPGFTDLRTGRLMQVDAIFFKED